MRRNRATSHARRRRRVRSRLTRAIALAVAGPLIMGSLAYAAGVGPVRRRVDEFLKGTARLFDKAETSTGNYHLSPNPVGQGVLVMPFDDRGPRPVSENSPEQDSGKTNKEKTASGADETGGKTEPSSADSKENKSTTASGMSKEEKSEASIDDSKESDSGSGSGSDEGSSGSSEQDWGDSNDEHSGGGSGDSDDEHSGSDSGSGHSYHDDSGSSSGEWDSHSDKD